MSWLRSLFAQGETIKRLEHEREFHEKAANEFKFKLEASEARADAMMDRLLAALGVRPLPLRALPPQADEIEEIDADPTPDAEFERSVEERAKQFRASAEQQGIEYTAEMFEKAKAAIRANPKDYLGN